jgi:H(+)-translocating pyrophosphatase
MGADLYESYYGSILAAMALAAAAAFRLDLDIASSFKLVTVAPALAGIGIILAIIGIFTVKTKEGATMTQLLNSLHMGVWVSSALIIAASGDILYWLLGDVAQVSWWGIWVSIIAGLIAGLVIAKGTEYYTSYENAPTQRISEQAQTGPATVIIAGIAEGMVSTWIPLITVVIAILVAFIFAGGNSVFILGVFGVGIAAVGMLSTLAITLATDAYGPIADNAGGNAEMTHQPPFVRERTDMLDSLGNTTAATGKGFAIGSAALTALALLAAYVITVQSSLNDRVAKDAQYAQAAPATPVYVDHGIFAVEFKGKAAAGILINARDTQLVLDSLATGKADLSASKHAGTDNFDGVVVIDGKKHEFDIVPVSTASLPQVLAYFDVTLMNPRVLSGLFIGVMLVFVFCSMTMNAVGRAAYAMMLECRRQFGIMKEAFKKKGMTDADIADPMKWPFQVDVDGKSYPDYANCVAISTAGAQKEMIVPSIMAVVVPVVVGLILGVAGVMGLLAGALVCGFAVAIFMANAGGAWDNAKKYIETGKLGGKGSSAHKAGVVGDTVGDPFKDTSGPSLNILIKLVSIVSVVFAGLIVNYSPIIAGLLGLGGN